MQDKNLTKPSSKEITEYECIRVCVQKCRTQLPVSSGCKYKLDVHAKTDCTLFLISENTYISDIRVVFGILSSSR